MAYLAMPYGVLRVRRRRLGHRQLGLAPYTAIDDVKTNSADAGVDRGVQQVDAADDVVRVVEALDEVAQAFGGVGGEMVDVREAAVARTRVRPSGVGDAAVDECRRRRHVLAEIRRSGRRGRCTSWPRGDESVRHVRADETGPTGHEYSAHQVLLLLVSSKVHKPYTRRRYVEAVCLSMVLTGDTLRR